MVKSTNPILVTPASPSRAAVQVTSRVLVIDDDEIICELLPMLLHTHGYTVETASTANDGLRRLGQPDAAFEIVLSDLQMPDLNVGSLANALHSALAPGMLLIGMSASDPDPEALGCFNAFVRKPFKQDDFETAVQRARHASCTSNDTSVHATAVVAPTRTDQAADTPHLLDENTFSHLAAMLPHAQLRELYRVTLHDVFNRHDHMLQLAAQGDLPGLHREAHAVKGGCGMVGALELQRLAAALEEGSGLDNALLSEIPLACQRLQRMLDQRICTN